MVVARRSCIGGGGSFPTPEPTLLALFNGSANGNLYAIGAATKIGAGAWTAYGSNPVLQVGASGQWDDATVKDPSLLHDGSQFICYYAGFDGTSYRIGRATAPAHTGSWTKHGSNPVMPLGSAGAFDDAGCSFPVVLHEPADTGREWKMWYTGTKTSDGKYRIGYAYSSDGLAWTKFGQVVDVGGGGTFDDELVVSAAIIKVGATYNLFYGGYQAAAGNSRAQGGLVTFTDPEGTYTKDAGNPVLLARFNDAGTSPVLTATTAAGSAIVTVPDTSAWNVNEPMAIADGDSETEIHSIASIDSGTQITFDAVCSSAFTSAGGTIRPLAYNAVQPRTVREAFGGGYEMFLTAFQPVEDLLPGGSKLREGSMRATASSPAGPWSYDYTTGLMFPLYPANTGWDTFSAENPSVIPAP